MMKAGLAKLYSEKRQGGRVCIHRRPLRQSKDPGQQRHRQSYLWPLRAVQGRVEATILEFKTTGWTMQSGQGGGENGQRGNS